MMERRQHRSERAGEAVGLYLAALARRRGLKAVALADRDGLLVAGAGEGDLEVLAALSVAPERATAHWSGSAVHVRPVTARGQALRVASVGASTGDEVAGALSRILAGSSAGEGTAVPRRQALTGRATSG